MKVIILPLVLALAGCASAYNGTTQEVNINTSPAGAECTVSNEVFSKTLQSPAIATVHRHSTPLQVNCKKGNLKASESFEAQSTAAYKLGMGGFGLISSLTDLKTGAAYEYPDVYLELK